MNSELEIKLEELRKGYFNKLKDIFSEFKALLEEEALNVEEIYKKVHTISGTSGMYGMSTLSEKSTELELYLKSLRENLDSADSKELRVNFLNYVNHLESIILAGE